MGLGRISDGLAPTPPMGWNSWNGFKTAIDERLILQSAEAIVTSGMKDAGYRYVVIDDGWQAEARGSRGDLLPDVHKFPRGMRRVADEVHALGLRFGIYTDAGTKSCAGLPGSREHERDDAQVFADWGVDYVKIDWCNTEGLDPRATYAMWSEALRETGRPMVLSICEWGASRPWEWASSVGHLWRTTGDILDRWDVLLAILDRQTELHPYAGPDHWNDPDMLEVGNGGMSVGEYRAHFALWAMLAAPLMAGNDVRTMSDDVRAILTAPEIIAVDQDPGGVQARRVRRDGDIELWVKPLADQSARAALLFNRGERPCEARIRWSDVGWTETPAELSVRDLWLRGDRGTHSGEYVVELDPHEAATVRVARGRSPS